MQPACQLLWFTGNYLDFIEHSVFQRLQPAQPLTERHSLNRGAKAELWEWQWQGRNPLFRLVGWPWFPYVTQPEVTDWWLTEVSWEERWGCVTPRKALWVCHQELRAHGPSWEDGPTEQAERSIALHRGLGKQLQWVSGLSEPNATAKEPCDLGWVPSPSRKCLSSFALSFHWVFLTSHFIGKAFSDHSIEKDPPTLTVSSLLLVFICLHFTYYHLSHSLFTCLCSALAC